MKKDFLNTVEKVNAFISIGKITKNLDNVNNLDELYKETNEIIKNVKTIYPEILCKAGCSQCCKSYGNPVTTPIEWEKINNFLDNSDTIFKEKIRNSLEEVNEHLNKVKEEKYLDFSTAIKNIKCPFLQNDLCSVYEVRPLICRMFGNFLTKVQINGIPGIVFYSCNMEKERWDKEIAENDIKGINLPHKKIFDNKLEQLNGGEVPEKFLSEYLNLYFNKSEPLNVSELPGKFLSEYIDFNFNT